jgi:flagellar biosynthesis protein FlhG
MNTTTVNKRPARVIAIASGKSGVGKSNITTNLAVALATRGQKVCILDADTRPSRTRDLLGFMPIYTVEHLLSGEKTLDDVITDGPSGVKIFPAAAGIADFVSMDDTQRDRFVRALRELEERFDCLLIDTAAGVRNTVMHFLRSAHYVVMVLTPEPSSLSNSFAMLQMLKKRGQRNPVYVLVNMVEDYSESVENYKRFERNVRKFLQIPAYYLGYIKIDETVTSSVTLRRPVILLKHSAPASQCFYKLAENLTIQFSDAMEKVRFSEFWKHLSMKIGLTAHGRHPTGVYNRPQIPQPGAKKDSVKDKDALVEEALTLLQDSKMDAKQAKAVIAPLIQACVERFEDYPFDTRYTLLEHLKLKNYPANELRQLVITLEDDFEKQHQRPIHNLQSTVLRLFAQAKGDGSKIEELSHHLRASFRNQFGRDLYNAPREILEISRDPKFSEGDFSQLLQDLAHSYKERFGQRWAFDTEVELLLEKVIGIVDVIAEQERSLNESLFTLFERLNYISNSKTGNVAPSMEQIHQENNLKQD